MFPLLEFNRHFPHFGHDYLLFTPVVFIPPSILTLGSGVAFAKAFGFGPGILLASAASFFGACVGAVIAFFRARYLMRDLIKLFARRYPIVKATDRAMKEKGFRIYVLLRMCPIIPFNALNYIGGITGIKWTAYTFALIGILPWQIVLVFIGATVGSVNNMREEDQNSYNREDIYRRRFIPWYMCNVFPLFCNPYELHYIFANFVSIH